MRTKLFPSFPFSFLPLKRLVYQLSHLTSEAGLYLPLFKVIKCDIKDTIIPSCKFPRVQSWQQTAAPAESCSTSHWNNNPELMPLDGEHINSVLFV